MRFLRTLLPVAIVCLSTSFLLADTADFKMNVLDPPTFETTYPVYVISADVFNVVFTPCVATELPAGITADGCFAGVNNSGHTWTALQMIFPNTPALGSQPASCEPASSDNIFSNTSCYLDTDSNIYVLNFANGSIPSFPTTPGDMFFIAETGVRAEDFPPGVATATPATPAAISPEPTSLVLLLSGTAAVGLFSMAKTRFGA